MTTAHNYIDDPLEVLPLDLEPDSDKLELSRDLDDLLDRYVAIYGQEQIWDTWRMTSMSMRAFRQAYPDRHLVKAWENDPRRKMIPPEHIVFDPTCTTPTHYINLFAGWKMRPKQGDHGPILELANHLFWGESRDPAENMRLARWALRWLAYPLQHPGAKMATAMVLAGAQGSGKSLFFSVMLRIYGPYGATIGQQQLESRFTEHYSRKLFVLAEEVVAASEQQHQKNALKHLVTGESVYIESKFQPVRVEVNHINFAFLSNDVRPLALEADDRRHAVYWVTKPRTDDLYQRVRHCLDNGGAEAFFQFLLDLDLADFHTHTPPPMTQAKRDMVELGLRPAERFARDWLDHQLDLPLWPCTVGQLYKAYTRWSRLQGERSTANQANFTATVAKYAGARLAKVKASPSQGHTGAPITFWQPTGTGPLPGVSRYEFAEQAAAAFDTHLARFAQFTVEPT